MIDAPQRDDDAANAARSVPVAIVGAGFSGTMAAAHLARKGIECLLIDAGGFPAQGTAYSTRERVHVLNVRAEAMSAWPDRPADFVEFAESEVGERDFAPRPEFGRYLRNILDAAMASGRTKLVESRATALGLRGGRWDVSLSDGRSIVADAVILAIGNQPPQTLPGDPESPRVISNPWGSEARAAIAEASETDQAVLIVGTGLTMVDTVLSLDSAGHRGPMTAISRRGLVPLGHDADYAPMEVAAGDAPTGRINAILRWLRAGEGEDWRARIDALRPHSHRIWQGLAHDEQRRFLRHARPWWDIHRHRIAPHVADKIGQMIDEERLIVTAGRIIEVDARENDVAVRYRPRGRSEALTERASWLFNCTGPLGEIARTGDPLLRALLDEGLAIPDDLGIGLAVDGQSRVAGSRRLWAMGPLTKGRYWEMTAVPDIREQAAIVAADIAMELAE